MLKVADVLFYLVFASYSTFTMLVQSEFVFRVQEGIPNGTVIASGSELSVFYYEPNVNLPIIVNRDAPGASSFTFVRRTRSPGAAAELELVVCGPVDRETICPTNKGGASEDSSFHRSSTFHIEESAQHRSQINPLFKAHPRMGPAFGGFLNNSVEISDCVVTLRVANGDKIFHLKLNILDVNDRAPSWETSEFHIYLRDGDPAGTLLFLPLAEDPDSGPNGEITYSLQTEDDSPSLPTQGFAHPTEDFRKRSATGLFELVKEPEIAIHSAQGLMLPRVSNKLALRLRTPIDREQSPEIICLTLVARDAGSPKPLEGRLKIIINVTDVNDNPPVFERPLYKVNMISEDTPVGTTLIQLHAQDRDTGPNAELSYRLEDNGQPVMELIDHFFQITQHGELKVRRRLNVDKVAGMKYLPTSTMTFGVEAVDGADPAYALTGRTVVQLQVSDTNDEAPKIQVYPLYPPKDAPKPKPGSSVDTTAQENGMMEQLLALVEVTDPDLEGLDSVDCQLKGPMAEYFQLTSQGSNKNEYSLLTNAQLDREATPRLEVSLICRDSADHTTRQDIGVNLLDTNDNTPVFDSPTYELFVMEDDGEGVTSAEGSTTTRRLRSLSGEFAVHATDSDAGINAQISYRLEPDPSDPASVNYFSINQTTGTLYATARLDREIKSWHKFIVVAVDHGTPALSSSAEVLVRVDDVNDNAPQFILQTNTDSGYAFSIQENESPGKFVGTVTAVDVDDMPNPGEMQSVLVFQKGANPDEVKISPRLGATEKNPSKLIYSLGSEKDAIFFRIDKHTGEITTRRRLDREVQSSYSFRVLVSDGVPNPAAAPDAAVLTSASGPRWSFPKERVHTTVTTVVVSVLDENDNSPTFIQPNSTNHLILLDPTTIPGRSLLQILAIDPDEGENGKVTYSIFDGNTGSIFNVDPFAGLLYLQGQIPRGAIEQANMAAYTIPVPGAKSSLGEAGWSGETERHPVGEAGERRHPDQIATTSIIHPTYVLGIEACDRGLPPRCSRFPNLQVQLRVPSDQNTLTSDPEQLAAEARFVDKAERLAPEWGRNSVVEQVIIGMTVFFAIVVLVGLLVVFLMRDGSCRLLRGKSKRDKIVETVKQTPSGAVRPDVELLKQGGQTVTLRQDEYSISSPSQAFFSETSWPTVMDANKLAFETRQTGGCGRMIRPMGSPAFSSIPHQTGCTPNSSFAYRNGYHFGHQIQQQPSISGYGALGPTSIVSTRAPPATTIHSTGYGRDEYQTLDPPIATNHRMSEGEAYYRTTQHLNNEMHPTVRSLDPEEGDYHRMLVTSAVDMETRFQPMPTVAFASQGHLNGDQVSPKSLDLKKHFPSETDEETKDLNPIQLDSKSIKARTLNFPKATFV
ncbi:hypothetical protein AAHC03_025830 [Spirometra sp. Aus1]